MCITEFNEKVFTDGIREEGRAEGRAEGRKEGRKEGRAEGRKEGREEGRLSEIFDSVQSGDYSVGRGAQKANMGVPEFEKTMAAAGYKIPTREENL